MTDYQWPYILRKKAMSSNISSNSKTSLPKSTTEDLMQKVRDLFVFKAKGKLYEEVIADEGSYGFVFNPKISQVYITLFQEGLKPIRWGSKKSTLNETLSHIVNSLSKKKDFDKFHIDDPLQCRILFEIIIDKELCNPKKTTILKLGKNRLEPGIHGLMFEYKKQAFFFMPTDAYVYGLMTMRQIYSFLAKRIAIAKESHSIKEQAMLVRNLDTTFYKIRSCAFITYQDQVLPLYRGNTIASNVSHKVVMEMTYQSCDWLHNNMHKDGRFLYFYDAVQNSNIDFNHPKNPGYYNILRHSGGTITLLRAAKLYNETKYLDSAEHSIKYLLKQIREHKVNDQTACYPFYNSKSKLGGAGIALVALMEHFILTQKKTYWDTIEGLVRHILSRIDENGEMIGYYIHPQFNNSKPILNPDNTTKRALFSFYYPGEALFGLALFYRYSAHNDLSKSVLEGAKKAMDFLIYERPKRYKDLFLSLPADGWLMQAIEEWIKVNAMRKRDYIDFVYQDADAMLKHMYRSNNSPYFDYRGGFFYKYGEHVLPDASRCEGLYSAYEIAKSLQDTQRIQNYEDAMMDAAQNLLYTYNSKKSTYAHPYPKKSIGAFRFKITRQWMRVDSVQHTACFYMRMLPILKNKESKSINKK